MVSAITANTTKQLVNQLLDRGYDQAASQVLRSILAQSSSGLIQQRLNEFEAECRRLESAGKKLTADNAVYRALLADLETTLSRQARLVDAASTDIQSLGIRAGTALARQLTLPGFSDPMLSTIGVRWNTPDPEAINRVISYINSPAWSNEISKFGSTILATINQIALRGIIAGNNPRTIAALLQQAIQTMPAARANTLMRTLQLTSYRDATSLSYTANADIIDYQVRIAALDSRTCMACIVLHGTRLAVGERINDHHNGRCTSVAIIRGRGRDIQSGESWFNNLSEAEKVQHMGQAAYDAWVAGDVQLSDFVHKYTDPIFGDMVREASLKGILGDAARKYYQR